jgi:dethiobiotin synthetase
MQSKMRIPGVMLVGTDTEVGKTFVACRLIEQWVSQGARVGAYKPVASGALSQDSSDASLLWLASGRLGTLEQVNPQSFSAPLAPPMAAELEGREVDDERIVDGAVAWKSECDFLVVEGAGGLMSPISWKMTNASLAQKLQLPLILVAPNKLGVVSQVLTTLTAAKALKLRIPYVVLNDTRAAKSTSTLSMNLPQVADCSVESNFRLLTKFLSEQWREPPKVIRLAFGRSRMNPPIQMEELIGTDPA